MSKEASAWMPFYIGDYLGDTQRLTTEQHGAYLLLILDYWRNGAAPDDDAVLQQITKLDSKGWKRCRPAISRLFKIVDGEWRHKRIEHELDRARANTERRSSKAKDGADAKWGDSADGAKGRHLRSERLAAARKIATHTAAEWERMKELCGNTCVRCGADGQLVKDHIKPIYQGGSDGIENLQPLCKPCNSSKGPEAIDHRPSGWQNAFGMPAKMPAPASAPQSPSPEANASPREGDFSMVEFTADLCRDAGVPIPDHGAAEKNRLTIEGWIGAGADRDLIRATVTQRCANLRTSPRSLAFFDKPVLGAVEQRNADASALSASTGSIIDRVLGRSAA